MPTLYVSPTGSSTVTYTAAQVRSTPAKLTRALAIMQPGDRIECELGTYTNPIADKLIGGPSPSQKSTIATVIDAPAGQYAVFQAVGGTVPVFQPAADNLCLERVELTHGDNATTNTHGAAIVQTDVSSTTGLATPAHNIDFLGCKIDNTRFHCVYSKYGPTPADGGSNAGTPGFDDSGWRFLGCEVTGANQHLFVAHGSGWEWGPWTNPYTGLVQRGNYHNWGNTTEAGQGSGFHGIYHHSRGAKVHGGDWHNEDANAIGASAISQRASGLEIWDTNFHDCVPFDRFWYDNIRGKTRMHDCRGWNLYNWGFFFNAQTDTSPAYTWTAGSNAVDDLTIAKCSFHFKDTHTNGSNNVIDLSDATAAYMGDIEVTDCYFEGDFTRAWDCGTRGTAFSANVGHTATFHAHANRYHNSGGTASFRFQNTTYANIAAVQAAGTLAGFTQEAVTTEGVTNLGSLPGSGVALISGSTGPHFYPQASNAQTVNAGQSFDDTGLGVVLGGPPVQGSSWRLDTALDIGASEYVASFPVNYQFQWGTTTSYGNTTTLTSATIPPQTAVSVNLTGLTAGTTYHYRLLATRADGVGGTRLAGDGTFTTTTAFSGAVPIPTLLTPTGITQTAATINGRVAQVTTQSPVLYHFEWGTDTSYGSSTTVNTLTASSGFPTGTAVAVSGSVDPKGASTQVFIDYGTDPDALTSNVSVVTLTGSGSQPFTGTVSGLTPNTIYWMRARAVNGSGTSISTIVPTRVRTPPSATGATWHVAANGSDTNTGVDSTHALLTIQKALSKSAVGDTVVMHAGTYPTQTITQQLAGLVTVKDAGDGNVILASLQSNSARNVNFEGAISLDGHGLAAGALVWQHFGSGPTNKGGPIYWAAGGIALATPTALSDQTAAVRGSSDGDKVFFDGIHFQGGGFSVKAYASVTPATSWPKGWRFTGCEFGPHNTWDVTHLGGATDWKFIGCKYHDFVSISNFTNTTTEEHHDAGQLEYADQIKWLGCYFYDHTNTIQTGPSQVFIFNDSSGGNTNTKIYLCVLESWVGSGINSNTSTNLNIFQTTIGNCPGSGDGQHYGSVGNTSDFNMDPNGSGLNAGIVARGVNARNQFIATANPATTIDKCMWRTGSSRAGTNAKSGAVTFVSTTDLHLANGTQAAATGGPIPSDDPDISPWDIEGRGFGSNPAIGAYASPTVTTPLFAGAVTCTPTVGGGGAQTFDVSANLSGLTAGTTYHYRLSAIRQDGGGGTQVSTDGTFTTQSGGGAITTNTAYGPTAPVTTTSSPAGGTFVVKSDGQIYDSGGTTLQDMTAKDFSTLVTIKSDSAGTRRALNVDKIKNCRFSAGLVFTEITFADDSANFEVNAPSTTYGIDFQGCSGRLGHFRIYNFAVNGFRLTASAASVTCGATGSTWDTDNPDLILHNFTSHAAGGATGSAVVVTKARNVELRGFDPGSQSTPTGLSGPAIVMDGAALDDVQDVTVATATDNTPSRVQAKAGKYIFHILHSRRCGWKGQLDNPVLFVSSGGNRPEKPVWLGSTDGAVPGGETSVNTTNAKVICDQPRMWNGIASNLVTFTFRNGATAQQAMEIDGTVWDPAASLSSWSDTTARFIDPRTGLGVRPTGATAPALVNKSTIDNTWTLPGGATGTVARAGDNWYEIRGVKFDIGTEGSLIWTDGSGTKATVLLTDISNGHQLVVAPAAQQPGGVMPTIPSFAGSTGGGATLKVTNPDGSPPTWFDLDNNGNHINAWPTTPDTASGESLLGIYTTRIDPNLGANAVDTGVGYCRQLGYTGINTAAGTFTGVYLIQGPTGGAINPGSGDVLTVAAGTPGTCTTFFPHGMATNDLVTISGNSQAAANGQFKITRVDAWTFTLQTTGGSDVAISLTGSGGTFTPQGPNGLGYAFGLGGTVTSLQLTAGDGLTSTRNDNLGRPKHNAQLNLGADATGKGIRFVGCDFFNPSLQAVDSTSKLWFVDCQYYVSDLPGKGIDYDTVDNGVRGTYDSSNQHSYGHTIGSLNVVAPAEALWYFDRCLFTNAHGDIMPGKFAVGSTARHCRIHHARDVNNTQLNGSISRNGIPPGTGFPKVAQGPHGDLFQNYDRNFLSCIGCDLHANGNNSVGFSQAQTNYKVLTGQSFTNSGGHYLFTPNKNHGFNVGDYCRIDNTGDNTLDGLEFLVTATTSTTVTLGTTTFVANRTGTATHVIHQFVDWRRNDIRTTRNWNRSSLTENTSLTGLGNKTFSQSNAEIDNIVTMNGKWYDNRFDTGSGGGSTGWVLPTPAAGSVHDFGTPNRNFWRNYLSSLSYVPGGVATPH